MIVQACSSIIFPQWYAGIGVMMLVLQIGILGGWSSPTLAILLGPNSPIPMTPEEGSWVASLLATLGASLGVLAACIIGAYLSISLSAAIYCAHCVLLMMMFLWLPESPHHLIKIGNLEAARKSVSWYRSGRGVDAEMEAVETFVTMNGAQSLTDKLKEFKTPAVRKATFQAVALFSFMQICGLNSITMYMEIILTNAKFNLFQPSLAVIYAIILGTISALISIFLIDRCGRKFLLLIASAGTTISLLGLMSHYLLINADIDVTDLQWLPLVSIFIYMIAYYIGLMPVPSTILSEIFPANIKGIAASIASLTGAGMAFLATKTYQPMVDSMGEAYVYLVYAVCTILIIPYTLIFMMETKGKSLQEIQDKLMRK
ncbi:hypothetical protein TSAR_015648 [Trichomalopsis sarcophagae]|uniref:Major facilitator superfamily (MFS) profile domain-containing protein n=1 Tax=Trichomalopsis sarcophagae TaxID=543379 RepID=A0A232F6Y1_9HYME|nr:hypothetical protein TSAR_015648 [Trichomalopsis sarcophagae]